MARKKKEKKPDIQVFLPELIESQLLVEHENNTQTQTKHEFSELKVSILDNGFDESLLVRPLEDGRFEIVAGNHRFRAGKSLGMDSFPCVVREDWDDVKVSIESIRRNYVRGKIDKQAFTKEVDRLAQDQLLPLDVIYGQMGFEDADAFAVLYEKERDRQKTVAKAVAQGNTTAAAVRIMDDLSGIVSQLLSDHGHTIPHSFIIFPTAGRNHLYVAANTTLKNALQAIGEQAVAQNLDINIALSGLIQIGLAHSNFLAGKGTKEVAESAVAEGDEAADFDEI